MNHGSVIGPRKGHGYGSNADTMDKLASLRRQVQLAADQAWPWRTPGVATIRKAFLLSPDRPMKD